MLESVLLVACLVLATAIFIVDSLFFYHGESVRREEENLEESWAERYQELERRKATEEKNQCGS